MLKQQCVLEPPSAPEPVRLPPGTRAEAPPPAWGVTLKTVSGRTVSTAGHPWEMGWRRADRRWVLAVWVPHLDRELARLRCEEDCQRLASAIFDACRVSTHVDVGALAEELGVEVSPEEGSL